MPLWVSLERLRYVATFILMTPEAGQRLVRQLFVVVRQVLVASEATWATVRDISLRRSARGAHPATPEVG